MFALEVAAPVEIASNFLSFNEELMLGLTPSLRGRVGVGLFITGVGSPVIIDSSTKAASGFMKLVAHVTRPSTGIFSPACTSRMSPIEIVLRGTRLES